MNRSALLPLLLLSCTVACSRRMESSALGLQYEPPPGMALRTEEPGPPAVARFEGPPSETQEVGKRKPPAKRKPKKEEGKRRRPVSLSRCLDSCAAGGAVFIDFCNDIASPATRAVCFSKANESEQQCRGFCSNYFGR